MGRNKMLSIMEVKLFTPFRYENDSDNGVWMLIGAPASKAGYHFIGINIDRLGFYCGTIDSPFDLMEPAKDVSANKFVKELLSKWRYDQEQVVAFMLGIGKDGRPQDGLKDFS